MSFKKGLSTILQKFPEDVVLVSALRTPVTKAKKGGLSQMFPEELLESILKSTIARSSVDPWQVEDIAVGTVLQALGGQKASAIAIKNAGFQYSTTISTINRQCSSSAQAAANIAAYIHAGQIQCGLAAGVESMTMDYFETRGIPNRISSDLINNAVQEAKDVLMPMGITSENVSREYKISRSDQDAFALSSHQKAFKAQESGWFSELCPVEARNSREASNSNYDTISKDDGIRGSITLEKLKGLPPAFGSGGATTAGNASQISDGASAVLLMSRSKAEALNLKPIGKFINSAVAGVPSRLMGIAPAIAVPKVLELVGITTTDVDVWELNEAFASQSLHVIRELKLDMDKVNVNGGAIALGHPLGATGGRCIATLMSSMARLDKKVGVVSMCASTGQGFAAVFVNECN